MHILTQKLHPGKNDFLKVFQQAGATEERQRRPYVETV